jgi:hypothetical protein
MQKVFQQKLFRGRKNVICQNLAIQCFSSLILEYSFIFLTFKES